MLKILCVGPQWRGSNAGGLFRALVRCGHMIEIVDENYFLNLSSKKKIYKAINKITRRFYIKDFNSEILLKLNLFYPDVVLIYKGAFVLPETLKEIKKRNILLANFYPDVSFRTHGNLLAQTLPLYDHIFTTKTFGIKDMSEQLGIISSSFVPHGFDPDLHRHLDISTLDTSLFNCDISFIGGYSEKKAALLSRIKSEIPDINLKVWGDRWKNCKIENLQYSIQHTGIFGDLYILGILSSKINLGILHEQVHGASSGDKITSRTFHIPGAGGFLLHERTEEALLYFKEGEEAGFFDSENELIEKVNLYLSNSQLRDAIRTKGYERAQRDHTLDKRAQLVINQIQNMLK